MINLHPFLNGGFVVKTNMSKNLHVFGSCILSKSLDGKLSFIVHYV
jgi:hypothetical protein